MRSQDMNMSSMKTRQSGLLILPPTVESIDFLESYDLSRFEGEGGSESPETAEESIDAALENTHRAAAVKPKPGETMKSRPACDLRVRKQVYELTLHDLNTFPIWEFKLDEEPEDSQDESTVQPCVSSGPLDPADRMFVVRAVFILADGSRMKGYLTPPGRGHAGVGTLQPIIVTDRGQVRIWCGTAAPGPERLARSYELLGKDAGRVFPLRFESDVELADGPVRGNVPGFLVLEDFQTRKTRTVI
jgi:hypothetical protein